MVYVALLRGINVGGNRKVDMKLLKGTLERAGLTRVKTYINSGNVVFASRSASTERLATKLEKAIEVDFGFSVAVLVRGIDTMRGVVKALPPSWVNDDAIRCEVLFLWPAVDDRAILKELPVRDGVDTARYAPGAVIWGIPRAKVTKSTLNKIVGTDLYKQITMRNCNTTRKLLELMESA